MTTYGDEYIEYWGEIFCNQQFADKGITFSAFLTQPDAIVQLFKSNPIKTYMQPLLPAQQQVRDKLDREQVEQLMAQQFERSGHVIEMHGQQNIERIHKRAGNKLWKTGLGFSH